nr:glycosyltransferase [Nitrospirota bacterium]
MGKITVLNLVASTAMGGAEKVILSIAGAIDRTAFDCRYCLFVDLRRPPPELYEMLRSGKNELSTVEIRRPIEAGQLRQLFAVVRKNRPQVLHTHGYRSDFFGLIVARWMGIPTVSTVHGWTSATPRLRAYEACHRKYLRYFDKVITVSQAIQQTLLESGVPATKLVRLNNAINVGAYPEGPDGDWFRRELAVGSGTKLIGTIGRLSVEKGLDYFLRAGARIIARDPSVKLVVVGEGPQQKELKALADALGIAASVIFCGYRRDVERIYPALDMFVLPSLTEGIPMALLEAMAFSRPVIASRVGGVPEIIEDGVTGLLVSPKDLEQLTERMWRLLCSPEAGAEMGRRARKCVESRFDTRAWIKTIEGIYRELAHRS